MVNSKIFLILFLIVLTTFCCHRESGMVIRIPEQKGFEFLSAYQFFSNLPQLVPNTEAGVIPYDLNMTLFSDYAEKQRFVYVPKGQTVPFDENAEYLDFPEGSVLIKHFYYPLDNDKRQYVETRLLIKRQGQWQAETYEWNDEQTDAQRTVIGKNKTLTVYINNQLTMFDYLIPNQNQCKNCHAHKGKTQPIGPRVHNLNKDYPYPSGIQNQLSHWMAAGIMDQHEVPVAAFPAIDDPHAPLSEKAKAYLTVNCASCHRRAGAAANSGFYLNYDNRDSLSLGYWKTPVAAGDGSGGHDYVVEPGHPEKSILLHRMMVDDVGARMPEIGRELMHEEGVALIREWIEEMD